MSSPHRRYTAAKRSQQLSTVTPSLMAEHNFFNSVGSRVNSSLCNGTKQTLRNPQKPALDASGGHRSTAECISTATPPSYPAKLLEGLSADDFGEALDDDTEALLLQLCGQTPHLLGPLDFWEAANQLLSAAEHGYCVLHSLNGNTYQL